MVETFMQEYNETCQRAPEGKPVVIETIDLTGLPWTNLGFQYFRAHLGSYESIGKIVIDPCVVLSTMFPNVSRFETRMVLDRQGPISPTSMTEEEVEVDSDLEEDFAETQVY